MVVARAPHLVPAGGEAGERAEIEVRKVVVAVVVVEIHQRAPSLVVLLDVLEEPLDRVPRLDGDPGRLDLELLTPLGDREPVRRAGAGREMQLAGAALNGGRAGFPGRPLPLQNDGAVDERSVSGVLLAAPPDGGGALGQIREGTEERGARREFDPGDPGIRKVEELPDDSIAGLDFDVGQAELQGRARGIATDCDKVLDVTGGLLVCHGILLKN